MASKTIAAISAGECDEELDEVLEAVRFRRDQIGRKRFRELRAGDRVKIVYERLSPKYLIGALATVKGKKKTKVVIDLDQRIGRFSSGVRVAPEWLEVVS